MSEVVSLTLVSNSTPPLPILILAITGAATRAAPNIASTATAAVTSHLATTAVRAMATSATPATVGSSSFHIIRSPNRLAALFDRDDHRVRTHERLDTRSREPGLAHPSLAVGPGKVETAFCLDQHVQAHQQTESVFAALVIDDRLIYNECAALGKRGMRLFEQHALLRQIPVMQNVAHDEDIGRRKGVRAEVPREKFYPVRDSLLGDEFLKDRLHFGQIVSGAGK